MKGAIVRGYWKIRHGLDGAIEATLRSMGIAKFGEHFYCDSLGPDAIVLDLGANKGEFSREMASRHGCKPILVEPNADLLEGVDIPGVLKINAVIAASDQPMTFYLSENPEASSLDKTLAQSFGMIGERIVNAMSLETLMNKHNLENIDLLKVDIEGGEIDMFNTTSAAYLTRCKQVTVEFHDYINEAQRKPAKNIVQNVSRLGFKVFKFSTLSYGRVLMINRDYFKFAPVRLAKFNVLQAIAFTMDYIYFRILVKSKTLLSAK